MRGTEGLREILEALPLRIDDIRVRHDGIELASYPDGPRPTSTIELLGGGETGRGEHVGWTSAEHEAFLGAATACARGAWRLADWVAALSKLAPYDRAALEAAAIDLALRQRGTSLLELAGVRPAPVRYVVSFARSDDPVAEAQREGGLELKIDADPAWTDETWRRLAALGRVAVVDFKLDGDAASLERASAHLPQAWIEDPVPDAGWPAKARQRWCADAPVTSVAALETLSPQPDAVNVKPARMGGVLEAISCLELCRLRGIPTYIGGMFEVGVARQQSLVLATLACPDGPNDIAPLVGKGPRPARLVADAGAAGFAGDSAA